MQPRTLESILSELDNTAGYGAQVQSLRNQQGLIPGQIADEEKGLEAKQGQAFESILGGARQRGLGFSGIPLSEQAKYTSTEFLPAIARLRQQGKQQAMSLEDSILGIQERRTNQALGIRNNEQQMAEQRRQFDAQMAAQRRAQAAASSNNDWMKLLTGGGGGQPTAAAPAQNQQIKAQAMNAVAQMMQRRAANPNSFIEELIAINKSAGYGNVGDQAKLELLRNGQPGLFDKNGALSQRAYDLINPNYFKTRNQLPQF